MANFFYLNFIADIFVVESPLFVLIYHPSIHGLRKEDFRTYFSLKIKDGAGCLKSSDWFI